LAKSRAIFACSTSARFPLISLSYSGIGASRYRCSASGGSDKSELLEDNQLLRVQARQIGVDLDIVIIPIFTLNRANSRVLEGHVALGNTGQLQVPVDEFGWFVFLTG
jgi:hypothetical protein